MARMPAADWLGEHSPKRGMDRYDIVCVHTIVGFAPAHAAHFSVHQGGTIQQSRDTRYRSAANLNGNHRVIAIENEDHGSAFPNWTGSNVPALTDAQVEANAQILAWAHETHGVPLQLCPDSRPGSKGLAYHRQGIDGNFGPFKYGGRVSGGEQWSSAFGKVCPGDRRIDQLPAILARAKQIVGGDSMSWNEDLTPGTPGNDITTLSHETLPDNWGRHAADLLGYAGSLHAFLRRSEFSKPSYDSEDTWTLPSFWRWAYTHARRGRDAAEQARDQAVKNGEKLDALLDAQSGLDTAAVLERIDARHAEAGQQRQVIADTMTARLDSIATLLSEHADGTLDAEQVVQRIGELLTTDA